MIELPKPKIPNEMMEELEFLMATRRHEVHEVLADAHAFGAYAAEGTCRWFRQWWKQTDLPEDENGFPACPDDWLLHAGAVTVLIRWELAGFRSRLPDEAPAAKEELGRLITRILNYDSEFVFGDDGAKLMNLLAMIHRTLFLPFTQGRLTPHAGVTMKHAEFDDEALTDLAELLHDFRHVLTDREATDDER